MTKREFMQAVAPDIFITGLANGRNFEPRDATGLAAVLYQEIEEWLADPPVVKLPGEDT